MSSLLSSYEDDFNDSIQQAQKCLHQLQANIENQKAHQQTPSVLYTPPPSTGPSSRSQQVQLALQTVFHLKDLLTSMSYELNEVPADMRPAAKQRVESYRRDVAGLETDISRIRQLCTAADRSDLVTFGGGESKRGGYLDDADDATRGERLMALKTTEKLQSGTSTLRKAEAYLAQTNEIGHSSMNTLRQQTEQMHRIRDTTHDVDVEVTEAHQVLREMQRTAWKHKLWLFSIIFLLFAFIVLIIYLKAR